jgi:hypothetical protein
VLIGEVDSEIKEGDTLGSRDKIKISDVLFYLFMIAAQLEDFPLAANAK